MVFIIIAVKTPVYTKYLIKYEEKKMKTKSTVQELCTTALLCAIGILIPMVSPLKLVIPPMSFTFASHVAIFIAMFMNPRVTLFVSLGTTLGFALSGLPLVVTLRALSHVVFSVFGAYWLQKNSSVMQSPVKMLIYNLVLGILHALGEVLVVTGFFLAGQDLKGTFTYVVWGLVGLGTVVHSMIDFYIAVLLWNPISKYIKMGFKINYKASKHIANAVAR